MSNSTYTTEQDDMEMMLEEKRKDAIYDGNEEEAHHWEREIQKFQDWAFNGGSEPKIEQPKIVITEEAQAEANKEIEKVYNIKMYYESLDKFLVFSGKYGKNNGAIYGTARENPVRAAEYAFQKYHGGSYGNASNVVNGYKLKMENELRMMQYYASQIPGLEGVETSQFEDIIKDFTDRVRNCTARRDFFRKHVDKVMKELNHEYKIKHAVEPFPLSMSEIELRFKRSII
ncbi:MAG: hypothetical protein Q4E47_01645 [Candidatus Saccharibacteria bacterium]|nr:hypothetical protein [Candidatus Saccharibacteria bacterium]